MDNQVFIDIMTEVQASEQLSFTVYPPGVAYHTRIMW